jgi:hypothetical protein
MPVRVAARHAAPMRIQGDGTGTMYDQDHQVTRLARTYIRMLRSRQLHLRNVWYQ